MLRRTKYAAIVLAIAMPAVLGGAQAAQATPLVQTCTTQSGHQLCFNQKGGLNNYNQPVIGYPPGDDNNAFGFKYMSLMCGGGKVTSNCPFTVGSDLNDRYEGDYIAAVENQNTADTCVGTAGNGAAIETACPDEYGENGGDGSIFILSPANGNPEDQPYYLVSRFWSDINYSDGTKDAPAWACAYTSSSAILLNYPTGQSGYCTWEEVVNV
jgi:hypothetical protein